MTAMVDPFLHAVDEAPHIVVQRPNPEAGLRKLRLTRASDITMRGTSWLWDQRIPVGALTLMAGAEGIGKSTLAYSLVADVTRGLLPGRYRGVPRSVLIVATEDSWSQTIKPRLLAAGADLERAFQVEAFTCDGLESQLKLDRDLVSLEEKLGEQDAALILLDPLMSRLGDGTDTHKDADVRKDLEPIVAMADRLGCAVLGIIHQNKGYSSNPLDRVMGSKAFTAVARAVLYVAVDEDDETVRLVGLVKNNLGRLNLPTLTFAIDTAKVGEVDGEPITTGKLRWIGESSRSIREALETAGDGGESRTVTAEAGAWLVDFLTQQGGSAAKQDVIKAGKAAGHGDTALNRAKARQKVVSTFTGYPRTAVWSLPGALVQSCQPSRVIPGESDLTDMTDTTVTQQSPVVSVESVMPVVAAPEVACHDCGWPEGSEGHAAHCDTKESA